MRIIVVLDGEVHESELNGQRVYRRGDVIFRPPFTAHANAASGTRSAFLRLLVSHKAGQAFLRRNGWRIATGHIDLTARDQFARLQSRASGDELLELMVPEPAYTGCSEHQSGTALRHAEIENCVSFKRLAASLNLEPHTLTRRFRKMFGMSPTEYRREARLRRALASLAFTEQALAEIAINCGYADQSHFTRAIKSATQLSPSAFRRASC